MTSTYKFCLTTLSAFLIACATRDSYAIQNPTQVLNILPAVFGIGNDTNFDGHWDTQDTGCCLAYNGLPTSYNYRSAIEFDLSGIPSTMSIQSATFNITYGGAGGFPGSTLQFNQYIGNGGIELADFEQINQIGPLLNAFGPGDGTLLYKVPVTSVLNSFRDQSQRFLGIMIQNTVTNQTYLYDPYLSVTYAVPEPAALTAIGAALAISLTSRRQKQTE